MSFESDLADLLESLIANKFDRIHVSVPAVVKKFDPVNGTVDVQLVSALPIEGVTALPTISNVPVGYSRTKDSGFAFKLVPEDPVLLIFCDLDITHWMYGGATGFARSGRRFNLNDCYAIPNAMPSGDLKIGEGNSAVLYSGDCKIEFKETGSVLINSHLEISK